MTYSDPTSLQLKLTFDGHKIEYRDPMELVQGGPEVGELYIDGHRVGEQSRFGGPLIPINGYIYVPMYTKSVFSSGFKLARVDLLTGNVSIIGKRKSLIYLDKIENQMVFFFTDMEKTHLESISIA